MSDMSRERIAAQERDAFRAEGGKVITATELAAVDPGIRDVVQRLNDAGFKTTDSGDGVSKPADWYASGEALPFPHVAAILTFNNGLVNVIEHEAHRMSRVCGDGWVVELSYATDSRTWVLFARKELEDQR